MLTRIAILVTVLHLLGCGPDTLSPRTPVFDLVEPVPDGYNLAADEAVRAANSYCRNEGISLPAYETPSVSCDSLDGDRFWAILYQGVTPIPGNHFMLLLNDATREIEYVAGE